MNKSKSPFVRDTENMNQENFYKSYCVKGDNGCCDECEREGVCCLGCAYRSSCEYRCRVQKQREKLTQKPINEIINMIEDKDESLLGIVVIDLIRTLSEKVEAAEKGFHQDGNFECGKAYDDYFCQESICGWRDWCCLHLDK